VSCDWLPEGWSHCFALRKVDNSFPVSKRDSFIFLYMSQVGYFLILSFVKKYCQFINYNCYSLFVKL
jgi:hypothetical protein